MLNSWFASKSSRHARRASSGKTPPALEHAQPGRSDASSVTQSLQTPGTTSDIPLDEVHTHINDYAPTPSLIHSADKETGRTPDVATVSLDPRDAHTAERIPPSESPESTTPFTPQDAILAQVFGKSVPAHAADDTPPPAGQPSVSSALMTRTSDSLPPVSSTQTPPLRVRTPAPRLTIYDPFSGVKLGEGQSAGEHTSMSPSTATATATPGDALPLPTMGDDRRLWSSLERILELQAEIAAMHADVEGVGRSGTGASGVVGEGGRVGQRKRSRRGQTLPVGDEEPEEPVTGLAVSEISTDHSEGEEGEDDDEDDVRGYGKRRRDEEFARLAEQFAQRKTAIGGIMNKLDDLTMALKTFHTLPPPLFDLGMPPPRADTMSPLNTSSPPLNVPNTPPNASLPLPAPPMVASSEGPEASAVYEAVASPVLPRTVLPTILLGAPHVESPADMHPAQSIFTGVL